ncbi:MAG: GGDEF domain-containing protein [Gammaproteobacteria bacterium]|nr:GGDEF domain-containing protein [Gammaproteobacteria bacterium]
MGLTNPTQLADNSIWEDCLASKNLPSPPGVATKLVTLAKQEETTFAEVEQLISLDPSLSAKLLKLANSSLYARPAPTESIKQAISQFGLNGTLVIALTFSLVDMPANKEGQLDYNHFWLRSLTSATLAKKIALLLKLKDAESYYLAGLIQDIGVLALATVRPTLYKSKKISSTLHFDTIVVEQTELGLDHSDIGAWILKQWEFPEQYIEVTGNSHILDPDSSELNKVISVVSHLADLWSSESLDLPEELESFMVDHLNIDEEMIPNLLTETSKEISEVAHLFGVKQLESSAISKLQQEANDALTLRSLMTQKILIETNNRVSALEQKSADIERRLDYDSLTGVHTRAYAYETIKTLFHTENRTDEAVSVIFVDLDDFKQVNDSLGHAAGDTVLTRAANILKMSMRSEDTIARVGGEEFLVIMANGDVDLAKGFCERLQNNLSSADIRVNQDTFIKVTASIGLSVHNETTSFSSYESLISAADRACYMAKHAGKNCWRYVESESDHKF